MYPPNESAKSLRAFHWASFPPEQPAGRFPNSLTAEMQPEQRICLIQPRQFHRAAAGEDYDQLFPCLRQGLDQRRLHLRQREVNTVHPLILEIIGKP